MNTKKFILGGLIGAAAYFMVTLVAEVAFYGAILSTHTQNGLMKAEEEISLAALILSGVAFGLLLSYVLIQTSVMNLTKGFIMGTVIGLLTNTTYDLAFYAAFHLFKGYKIILLDIALYAVLSGLAGAAVGWYMGRSKTS